MSENKKLARTIIYFAGILSLGFVSSIIGPSLPSLAKHTDTSLYNMGFLFTCISVGYLIGAFSSGMIYDRIKGHPLLTASLISFSIILFFIPILSNLLILIFILIILGIAEGTVDVGCNTLLVWVHKRKVGPYMNALHFFFGLGALISPLIVGLSIKLTGNIKYSYWLISILLLLPAMGSIRLKSPTIHKIDENNSNSSNKDVILVLLFSFFYFFHVGAELSYGGWVYSYSIKLNIISKFSSIYLNSAFWGALTVGRLFGVLLSSIIRSDKILLLDILGAIIASILLLLFHHSGLVLWVGTILMGLSIASLFPTGLNYIEGRIHITGSITSWVLIGSSIGSMFFPWLIGRLLGKRGLQLFPFTMLSIFISALIVLTTTLLYAQKSLKLKARQLD